MSPVEEGKVPCFAVRRGDVSERFNVLWGLYKIVGYPVLERIAANGAAIVTLADLICEPLRNGVFKKPDRVGRGIRLINVFDLYGDTVVNLEMVERLDVSDSEAEGFKVATGDVFFTRSSIKPQGVAWSAYLESCHEDAVFECHLIRARIDEQRCLPGFLSNYARTWLARQYLIARASVTTMATIDQGSLAELPIVLPNINTQKALLGVLNESRIKRIEKLAEADALLSGLDDFLLKILELTPPPSDDRKVFAVCLRAARTENRMNSDYFHPERILSIRALISAAAHLNVRSLVEMVDFERNQIKEPGDNYLSLAHVQSQTGELTDSNETAAGACFTFQTGDVLFARLRPYLNKVYRAEMDGCCSPEFHVMRVKSRAELLPDYLAVILRSRLILAQTVHMMTGNTHPRLANEDVINLRIPIPSPEVQETIATEVRRRRDEARRLRAEAEAGWMAAKRWFEEQLLGCVEETPM